jgi:Flp pilus assembly protein TadD
MTTAVVRGLSAALCAVCLAAGACTRVPKIIVLNDPLTAAEHVDLGVSYERKGELELARREYRRALKADPDFFRARVNLGNVYLAEKDYGKARAEYLEALDLKPGDIEAINNLAWASLLSETGVEEALERVEKVVGSAGAHSATLLDTLGVLRMRTGRPEEAARAFALADGLCENASPPREETCPPGVRRELEEHRRELLRRYPSPPPSSPLVR